MATSGSTNFAVSRDDILKTAYMRMGVLSTGESMSASQVSEGSLVLNLMTKEWQADGANLWATQYAYMFLNKTQKEYNVGTNGDHITGSKVSTSLSAAAASGATTFSVDDSTGISVADNIGIVDASGEIKWLTVASVPSSTSVATSGAVTLGAPSGAAVHAYTTKLGRPLRITDAYHHSFSSDTDTPVSIIERNIYDALSVKSASGLPNELYYDPQLETGKIHIWPVTDNESDYLVLTVQRSLEDFDSTGNTPDFPIEWGEALIWNLAYKLAFQYGVPQQMINMIKLEAYEAKKRAEGFDREFQSITFQPDYIW